VILLETALPKRLKWLRQMAKVRPKQTQTVLTRKTGDFNQSIVSEVEMATSKVISMAKVRPKQTQTVLTQKIGDLNQSIASEVEMATSKVTSMAKFVPNRGTSI
jgi:hypothetical protein